MTKPDCSAIPEYKILVTGSRDRGVGKQTLLRKFWRLRNDVRGCYNFPYCDYKPESSDSYNECNLHPAIMIDGEAARLLVYTTMFSSDHNNMPRLAKGSDGFLILYSITDRATFDHAHILHKEIVDAKGPGWTQNIILVANKCDDVFQRRVGMTEGRELSLELGCKFMECSAKQGDHVTDVMENLVREIRKNKHANRPKPAKTSDDEDSHGGCCSGCLIA